MVNDLIKLSSNDSDAPNSPAVPFFICKEWTDFLAQSESELQRLAGSTEREFLAIGERLRDFYRRAEEISKSASSVVGLISKEEFSSLIKRLPVMLERINGYIENSKKDLGRVEKSLLTILNSFEEVSIPLSGFKKIVKDLRMLGIHVKIFSAGHVHGNDFRLLAEDISSLSSVIEDKYNNIQAQSRSSELLIRKTVTEFADLKTGLENLSQKISANTASTLNSLTQKHSSSSTYAREVSERSSEISRVIGNVLESLQIHDITRQMIEHAMQEFDHLNRRFLSDLKGTVSASDSELIEDAAEVCCSQSAELCLARDELASAIGAIIENLRGISKSVSQLSEDTKNIAGVADEETSFFLTIESGMINVLSHISESFFESSKTDHRLSKAIESVVLMVGDISKFIKDIDQIAMEMELLAFNARIKAAHSGDEGAGLAVLSEAIQQVSHDVGCRVERVSMIFTDITDAAGNMNIKADSGKSEKDEEIEGIILAVESLLDSLRQINAMIINLLTSIDENAAGLGTDIEKTVSEINIHRTAGEALDKVISALNEIMNQSRPITTRIGPTRHRVLEISAPTSNVEIF